MLPSTIVRAERAQLVRVERLDRRLRPDRHERGRRDVAVRGAENAGARAPVGRRDGEGHRSRSHISRAISSGMLVVRAHFDAEVRIGQRGDAVGEVTETPIPTLCRVQDPCAYNVRLSGQSKRVEGTVGTYEATGDLGEVLAAPKSHRHDEPFVPKSSHSRAGDRQAAPEDGVLVVGHRPDAAEYEADPLRVVDRSVETMSEQSLHGRLANSERAVEPG